MNDLEQLTIRSARAHVAEMLRKAIFEGVFKPGDVLKDLSLARQLDVSRGPVREALLQLEKESLVRNVHNRGWYVIQLSLEDVREIICLRVALEILALKCAAENVRPSDLDALSHTEARLRVAVQAGDRIEVVRKNFELHRQIWHLATHPLLEETLVRITTPYFAFLQASAQNLDIEEELTINNHQMLIDYLARTTSRTAEECIAAHLGSPSLDGWDALLKKMVKKNQYQ